jgi:hypothetical protein
VVFLGPRTNAELVHKIHVALRACHAALPKINFKIFAKTQTSQSDQNFVTLLPSKRKLISNTQLPSPATCPQQSIGHYLTLFTSKRFTLLKAYLSQKDERPLLGNLQSSKHF